MLSTVALAEPYTKYNYIGYTVADKVLEEYKAPVTAENINSLLNGMLLRFQADNPDFSAEENAEIERLMSDIGTEIYETQQTKQHHEQADLELRQRQEQSYFERLSRIPTVYRHPTGLIFTVIDGVLPSSTYKTIRITKNLDQATMLISIHDQFEEYILGSKTETVRQTTEISKMLPALQLGLAMMNIGDTYIFYVPSKFAYGTREVGSIKANSSLTFKVTLLERCDPSNCTATHTP